jgi:hypothetical protein
VVLLKKPSVYEATQTRPSRSERLRLKGAVWCGFQLRKIPYYRQSLHDTGVRQEESRKVLLDALQTCPGTGQRSRYGGAAYLHASFRVVLSEAGLEAVDSCMHASVQFHYQQGQSVKSKKSARLSFPSSLEQIPFPP